MAVARVEYVRLRDKDSEGLQNMVDISDATPATKTITSTALTGAGRFTAPSSVNGFAKFHARITADADCIVTVAPKGDAGTSYDASTVEPGGIVVIAKVPQLIPISDGQKISVVTTPFTADA